MQKEFSADEASRYMTGFNHMFGYLLVTSRLCWRRHFQVELCEWTAITPCKQDPDFSTWQQTRVWHPWKLNKPRLLTQRTKFLRWKAQEAALQISQILESALLNCWSLKSIESICWKLDHPANYIECLRCWHETARLIITVIMISANISTWMGFILTVCS